MKLTAVVTDKKSTSRQGPNPSRERVDCDNVDQALAALLPAEETIQRPSILLPTPLPHFNVNYVENQSEYARYPVLFEYRFFSLYFDERMVEILVRNAKFSAKFRLKNTSTFPSPNSTVDIHERLRNSSPSWYTFLLHCILWKFERMTGEIRIWVSLQEKLVLNSFIGFWLLILPPIYHWRSNDFFQRPIKAYCQDSRCRIQAMDHRIPLMYLVIPFSFENRWCGELGREKHTKRLRETDASVSLAPAYAVVLRLAT